jgi:hypothetical protein
VCDAPAWKPEGNACRWTEEGENAKFDAGTHGDWNLPWGNTGLTDYQTFRCPQGRFIHDIKIWEKDSEAIKAVELVCNDNFYKKYGQSNQRLGPVTSKSWNNKRAKELVDTSNGIRSMPVKARRHVIQSIFGWPSPPAGRMEHADSQSSTLSCPNGGRFTGMNVAIQGRVYNVGADSLDVMALQPVCEGSGAR